MSYIVLVSDFSASCEINPVMVTSGTVGRR